MILFFGYTPLINFVSMLFCVNNALRQKTAHSSMACYVGIEHNRCFAALNSVSILN
jgi:hypothetical protein